MITYKFIILCGRYRFCFLLIVLPWFGHVFSNKWRFGHKRKVPGFFYNLNWGYNPPFRGTISTTIECLSCHHLHKFVELNSIDVSELYDFILRSFIHQPKTSWWLNHPFEKYDRQNGFIFPKFRGENKKYLEQNHLLRLAYFWCRIIITSTGNQKTTWQEST